MHKRQSLHDIADVDAACSAILLSKLLDFCEVANEIIIFDFKIEKWTNYFLTKLGYDLSKYLAKNEDKNRKLFLVDHYETYHEGTVIGCIDHHFTSKVLNYGYYLYDSTCSAAYLIYKLIEKIKFPITKEIVSLVAYASLVDTCCFKSTKYTEIEKIEIVNLLERYDFNVNELLIECLCIDNLNEMSLDKIVSNGFKKYKFGDKVIKSSYIQIKSSNVESEIIDYIKEKVIKEKIYMWVFIIFDMIKEKTVVYKVMKEQVIIEIYDKILSRGKDIIPLIEEKLLNN